LFGKKEKTVTAEDAAELAEEQIAELAPKIKAAKAEFNAAIKTMQATNRAVDQV
jgi:hypothetical protein